MLDGDPSYACFVTNFMFQFPVVPKVKHRKNMDRNKHLQFIINWAAGWYV